MKDPEGKALTYQMVNGPAWAAIQANDLFSAFGPTAELKDKEVIFDLAASDEAGNTTYFKVKVKVTP